MRARMIVGASALILMAAGDANASPDDAVKIEHDYLYVGHLPNGKAAAWNYIVQMAQVGLTIKAQEQGLSGADKIKTVGARAGIFRLAAEYVEQWRDQYLTPPTTKGGIPSYAPDYVYADYYMARMIDLSGDYWTAKKFYNYAVTQSYTITPANRVPSYNGTSVITLANNRLRGIEELFSATGDTPPYDRVSHGELSVGKNYQRDAIRFDLDYAADPKKMSPCLLAQADPTGNALMLHPELMCDEAKALKADVLDDADMDPIDTKQP